MIYKIKSQILREDFESILKYGFNYNNLFKKNILITGASGFLAAYLTEFLLYLNSEFSAEINIIGLVRNLPKARKRFQDYVGNPYLKIVEHDVTNKFESDFSADFIIHSASQASPKYYGVDPVGTLLPNMLGTYWLLEYARKVKAQGLLFFSSGEVYGQVASEHIPIAEKVFGYLDPAQVRSCYAESKRMGESLCVSFYTQYGVNTRIVRPFHTYGPGMDLDDGRVFTDFVANVIRNENIEMKSDGSALRPYCYISDATAGFLTVLLHGEDGNVYNVGNPTNEISVLDLAERLVRLYPEKNLKVVRVDRVNDKSYIQSPIYRNSPDIKKINQLGWSPKVSIESGFRRTIESYIC